MPKRNSHGSVQELADNLIRSQIRFLKSLLNTEPIQKWLFEYVDNNTKKEIEELKNLLHTPWAK